MITKIGVNLLGVGHLHGVIFDLDGTLADTAADLIAAANATFAHLGYDNVLDPQADAKVAMQGGGRAMLKYGFGGLGIAKTDAEIEEYYPLIIKYYAQNLCVHSRLYDGCEAALVRLHDAGFALGVCTNKPGALALPLLDELGISGYFGAVVAADTLPVRKPNPAPYFEVAKRLGIEVNKSTLIGDSVTDRETARAANVASILVTFGPIGQEVHDLSPEFTIDAYPELDGVLDNLFPSADRKVGSISK